MEHGPLLLLTLDHYPGEVLDCHHQPCLRICADVRRPPGSSRPQSEVLDSLAGRSPVGLCGVASKVSGVGRRKGKVRKKTRQNTNKGPT